MKRLLMTLALLGLATALPANALGPVDGEVGAIWWQNDFEVSGTCPRFSQLRTAAGSTPAFASLRR